MPKHVSKATWRSPGAEPSLSKATDIDRRQCQRTVPMRVLVLDLSRTGTHSLRIALEQLGYHSTYHGFAAALENPRDCEMWLAALRAKFEGKGRPFGKEEFDQLLGHCQAVSDIPAACFAEELISAYPGAKVILTNRDIDEWYESNMRNLIPRIYNPYAGFIDTLAWLLRSTGRWSRPAFRIVFEKFFASFEQNGKLVYREHYAAVRRIVPAANLLEYHVSEGWEPLVRFLGHEKPSQPFPEGNEGEMVQGLIRDLVKLEARKACRKLILIILLCMLAYSVALVTY